MKRVYRAEAVVPGLLPAEVHAQESVIAQIGVDALPVGRGRARGVTVLPVGAFGIRLRCESLQEQLAVGTPQAENRTPPPVVVGGGEENSVSPDDGGRVPASRQLDLPEDVFPVGPGVDVVRSLNQSLTGRPSPARPVIPCKARGFHHGDRRWAAGFSTLGGHHAKGCAHDDGQTYDPQSQRPESGWPLQPRRDWTESQSPHARVNRGNGTNKTTDVSHSF